MSSHRCSVRASPVLPGGGCETFSLGGSHAFRPVESSRSKSTPVMSSHEVKSTRDMLCQAKRDGPTGVCVKGG